ncbi:BBE domain-containing protein [Kitasatospora sp. NPDC004240]
MSDLTAAHRGYEYQDNCTRLQKAKATWNPTNVFHHARSVTLPS